MAKQWIRRFVPRTSCALIGLGVLLGSSRLTAQGLVMQRNLSLPMAKTIAEAALPGFVYDGWFGLFAPSRTPRTIINSDQARGFVHRSDLPRMQALKIPA